MRACGRLPLGFVVKPTYFISDLHFEGHHNESGRRVLDFLRARRGEAAAVYLVGDVFDLWLGHTHTVYHAYFPLLRALADLVEAGTRVVLFSGNHDPDPGPFLRSGLGLEVHDGPLWLDLGGQRVWIEHGDVIDPRARWRRALNRAARSPLLHGVARAVPPALTWRLARAYGGAVGHTQGYKGLPPGLVSSYLPERAAAGADVVILGHYHRAVDHTLQGAARPCRLFVLGDWVAHHTFLRFTDRPVLMRDLGPDLPPIELGPGDHAPPGG